ncbi:hypothetical protein V2G26_008076 [Clonostachys chloroleuca]
MTSLSFSRQQRLSSSIFPFHNKPRTTVEGYDMDELEPRPIDSLYHDDDGPGSRPRQPYSPIRRLPRSPSPDAWQDRESSTSSLSQFRPKPMFSGPPPPIAASIALSKKPTSSSSDSPSARNAGFGSLLFDYNYDREPSYRPDATWRGLRRQEKSLEKEVQLLLDQQASGLVAGLDGLGGDDYSDTGSSTPTGTFYSTATSKSRMINSLHVPNHSTRDGNLLPVRQPKASKARGLRSARTGLRRSMAALAQLKLEEDVYVDEALSQRRRALNKLERLNRQRENVTSEMHMLEEDEEEPLGKELRDLSARHDAVNQEIRVLEEKLVGMRNQRKWLRDRMEDVKNRREAGLSGYRGALKNVDSEVTALMHRPPFQPLDLEALQTGAKKLPPTGGVEFLRLRPERRNLDMAKSWWENEVLLLEKRKSQIKKEKEALDNGSEIWDEVMRLVSDYETRLRQLMQEPAETSSSKGKEKVPSQESIIQSQLPEMDKVVTALEGHMKTAEEKRWNLLICAIGAELEAFEEARSMLQHVLDETLDKSEELSQSLVADEGQNHDEGSDNEVPPDLLVSHYEDQNNPPSVSSADTSPVFQRTTTTDSDVPPDLLAEHGA